VRYVHAPVFMVPANCAEGTGWMLISGDPARHEALQPALQRMTGSLVYLGPQPERAAAFKLFGNLTLLGIWESWATWAGWPRRWASTSKTRSACSSTSTPAKRCRNAPSASTAP